VPVCHLRPTSRLTATLTYGALTRKHDSGRTEPAFRDTAASGSLSLVTISGQVS